MTTCERCAELDRRIELPTTDRYLELAEATRELVDDGTLTVVEASLPLASLRRGHPLPDHEGDSIQHVLACTACARHYVLWADTYHGRAAWEPRR